MNKRKFITKTKVNEVAKFLKESVETLKKRGCGCYHYDLDCYLALYIGWSNGFDMSYDNIIKSPTEQHKVNIPSHPWICGWAISASIRIRNDEDCVDYDELDLPYFEDSEQPWDTAIEPKPMMSFEDYKIMAKRFLKNYVDMVNESEKKNTFLRFE